MERGLTHPSQVDIAQALQLPAYGNLSFLPKWPGFEDDEEPTPESLEELRAKAASSKKGANAKRQIGRLKAQGIAVDVPRSEEQRVKRAEANRERKKRRKGGAAVSAEGQGVADGAAVSTETTEAAGTAEKIEMAEAES